MGILHGWTDYPFEELGDIFGAESSIRPCQISDYDSNKYCEVTVCGIRAEIKSGYIYANKRKQPFKRSKLRRLQVTCK